MDLLLDKLATSTLGVVCALLFGAVVKVYLDYKRARDEKDKQGQEFLKMFAESQSDAFAQIQKSQETASALAQKLEVLKEQSQRVEAALEKIRDR